MFSRYITSRDALIAQHAVVSSRPNNEVSYIIVQMCGWAVSVHRRVSLTSVLSPASCLAKLVKVIKGTALIEIMGSDRP